METTDKIGLRLFRAVLIMLPAVPVVWALETLANEAVRLTIFLVGIAYVVLTCLFYAKRVDPHVRALWQRIIRSPQQPDQTAETVA